MVSIAPAATPSERRRGRLDLGQDNADSMVVDTSDDCASFEVVIVHRVGAAQFAKQALRNNLQRCPVAIRAHRRVLSVNVSDMNADDGGPALAQPLVLTIEVDDDEKGEHVEVWLE